jgi:flavin reductase (DIM6/NTAB) family NADH-FMN oxidoreductase RutF
MMRSATLKEGTAVKQETRQAFVFPNPVALITVPDYDGRANIITLAWVGMACSDPVTVTVAVRPSRYSNGLLRSAGEFVLNIPSEDMVEVVDHCGMVSGRDHDKWAETGLSPEPAHRVSAPRIAECAYALECRVIETLPLGAHDMFVAKVLGAYADERILTLDAKIDQDALRPLAYVPNEYRAIGPTVYRYGDSARKR